MLLFNIIVAFCVVASVAFGAILEENHGLVEKLRGHDGPVTYGVHHFASVQDFVNAGKRCGTKDPTAEQRAELDSAVAQYIQAKGLTTNNLRTEDAPMISIPVQFHVITHPDGTGAIPNSQIKKQIRVMNHAYKFTGFEFTLAGVTRTVNAAWFGAGQDSSEEVELKAALHVGKKDTLNVYTGENTEGLLGWATFPFDREKAQDGVIIHWASLPDGSLAPYNLGQTLTHEVGHWMGLYHTFQGGCDPDLVNGGDGVADTNPEGAYSTTCDKSKDTCTGPGFEGKDPVTNYMDYALDECMNKFTPGQTTRMQAIWDQFRKRV